MIASWCTLDHIYSSIKLDMQYQCLLARLLEGVHLWYGLTSRKRLWNYRFHILVVTGHLLRFSFTPEIMILRESKDGKVGRPGLTGWLSHILTKGHGRGTGDVMDAGKVWLALLTISSWQLFTHIYIYIGLGLFVCGQTGIRSSSSRAVTM